jgi:hypothetical protein
MKKKKKTMDWIIVIKGDFDYGRGNGIGYIATFFSFATYMEILKVNRIVYAGLIILGLILTWFWGYLLRVTWFRKKETEFCNTQNPTFMEMSEKIIKDK